MEASKPCSNSIAVSLQKSTSEPQSNFCLTRVSDYNGMALTNFNISLLTDLYLYQVIISEWELSGLGLNLTPQMPTGFAGTWIITRMAQWTFGLSVSSTSCPHSYQSSNLRLSYKFFLQMGWHSSYLLCFSCLGRTTKVSPSSKCKLNLAPRQR